MSRRKFRLARNRLTGELEWAAEDHGGPKAWLGWFMLVLSTMLFLLVAGYFAYRSLAALPPFNPASLPDGGASMRGPAETVVRLR